MKISYNWLKRFVDCNLPPQEVADLLTQTGLEVGHITPFELIPNQLILGKILTSTPHPNAERLKITTVHIGTTNPLTIVCGAPNATAGQKVVVAPIGTTLTLANSEELKIKKAKIRGQLSEGMLCAADELGLGTLHNEIITLKSSYPAGTPMTKVWDTPPDHIFDIELTPNRNDAISHLGVARDLAAVLNKTTHLPIIVPPIPTDNLPIQITIKDKKNCLRYTNVIFTNLQIQDSPIWLQNSLKSIGIRPINNIVDITNYIMHETGQPLHAFDYDKIKKKIILQKLPKGTLFTALDGVEYKLTGEELMICDTVGPLAMAGIIGGDRGKVTEKTTKILLESAYFDPASIYRTARIHRLHTEASYRFERGIDPMNTHNALQKAVQTIQKYTGGKICSMLQDNYPTKVEPKKIPITYAYITRIVGFEIPIKTVHRICKGLSIQIETPTETGFTAIVPPYRSDVTRPIDLVEELLRIYGYNKKPQPTKLNSFNTTLPSSHHHKRATKKKLHTILATKGYHEIYTNSLQSEKSILLPNQAISIANPLSQKQTHLRQTLLFSGLEVVAYNLNRKEKVIKLFETGKVYHQTKTGYQEQEKLGIWLTGPKANPTWASRPTLHKLLDLQASLQYLIQYTTGEPAVLHPVEKRHFTKCLTIQHGQKTYGYIGQVSPETLSAFDIDITKPLYYAEIEVDLLLTPPATITYQPISKFPSVIRDISIAVSNQTTYTQIHQVIKKEKIPTLQDFTLIDHYHSSALGKQKKAYTFRCTLQSRKKTFKEKEINKVVNQIIRLLKEAFNAEIRE